MPGMRRRDFVTLLGGATLLLAAKARRARAQQPAMPVVALLHPGAPEVGARDVEAFRKGLNETGYIEGRNVIVEYHWLEGQYDRLPALIADLIRRPVDVIAIPGSGPATRAAKAATATIPIAFGVAGNPVQLGLVASLARPGGNATGVNFLSEEVAAKRLRLLHELVPNAARVAVLVNPANEAATENTLRDLHEAAPIIGCKSKYSKPVRSARSMRLLPRWGASAPMLCSSVPTDSLAAAVCNLRSWLRATEYRPLTRNVVMWQPAG